jgi:hypothetical protein
MTLDELRKLSPEQAMQAAAKELALPADFFDRMWTRESGRGTNMRSRAGAEGHFQIMPKTRAAWESRHGKQLNPDDFYDGLFMASETMRENLGRFKDPVDATRAYNGGWDPARWNNPETVGYVAALWGDKAPAASKPAAAAPAFDAKAALQSASLALINKTPADVAPGRSTDEQFAELAATQARREKTGVGEVFSEGMRDPRVMPTWTILQRFSDEDRKPDPAWDYMANRERIEKDLTEDEREYLRENAVSEATAQRSLNELAFRRDVDQTYAHAGGFKAFVGQMGAGLTDPGSFLMGLGVMKAFQLARVGSGAMIAAGRPGAAVASQAAEAAAGNVLIEGTSDVLGETKTSADYAMAAIAGATLTAPFARGTIRQANEAAFASTARDLQTRAVQEQIAKATSILKEEPGLTPEQVARRIEQDEADTITRSVTEATGAQRLEPVVPPDVRAEMTDEFMGVVQQDTPTTDVKVDTPDTPPAKAVTEDVLTQIRDKGEVIREATDKATGDTIRLSWSAKGSKLRGHGNVGEALDALAGHPKVGAGEKALATYLKKVVAQDGLEVEVRLEARQNARSVLDPNGPQVRINEASVRPGNTIAEKVANLSQYGVSTILHEVMHVATYHRLNAWEKAAGKLTREQQRVLSQFEDLFERFRSHMRETVSYEKRKLNANTGANYAAKNLHEFAAQFFTDAETRKVLDAMPGKALSGRTTSALREMLGLVRKVLGLGNRTSAFEEGARLIDQIIAMPVDNITYRNGKPVYAPPAPTGGNVNPMIAQRARDTWAERMVAYATDYLRRNPIDTKRLEVLTDKIGGTSDGLVLAKSQNPIMQLVASLVTETTTGAAGRKANVAIRSVMLHRKFVGNAMIDYDSAYTVFRNRNGGSAWEDAFAGNVRRKFDAAVYEEVLLRKRADHKPHSDRAVTEAADALEGLFDRSRVGQVDAGVLGFANLPGSSRGYIPQALDGVKLQAASVQDIALLHDALAVQFQERLGWDEKFARDFAPFYTERARRRAMGDKAIDGLGSGGEGLQLVRDTLEEMQADPSLVDRARAAESKMGQGHTKKRLDLDLLAELRPGLRMLEFFNTNPLLLARSYAKRTAGTAALTEAGIHGIRGVRELRQAALFKGTVPPTKAELDAFDRVVAEIMGTPVAGAVVSAGASNMQLIVSLQKLGGLVFTQAAETYNMLHHLGLRSLLSGIGDLPKMLGEVGRLKRGAPSGNHILTSIEQYGGEIGMETYKMIAPLDAPDHALAAYVDQPGIGTRLLRAGGHLQSKVSGFRGLMAAQHRMVAEQIVMKALRYIRDNAGVGALPPPAPGLTRLWHGSAQHGRYDGKAWFSTDRKYAENYRGDTAELQYVDYPTEKLNAIADPDGYGQTVEKGFTVNIELDAAETGARRSVRGGKTRLHDQTLADMGFTPEVVDAMKTDLAYIAKWDANDRLLELDLTRVSDARTAEAFVQAVHRGTSQIIQGTFAGERNAWFHNDYMRLLLQLRTFGLTATEKQWGRTRMNHGYTYAAGLLLGQMALSLPIHAARVQLAAAGREDRDKYIKDNMSPGALVRASMNYASLGGLTGDVTNLLLDTAGGWSDKQTQDLLGVRRDSTSVGRLVPVAGTLDTAARVVQGKTDLHTALKQLPFSNLWYLVPAINLTKGD